MSRKSMYPWLIVLALAIVLSTVVACGPANPLVGKWQDEEGVILEFKSDGKFSISFMGMAIEGDYVVAGDKVTLSAPDLDDEDIVLQFSIAGDKLTMTDEYGDVTEFTRVK